MGSPDPKVVQSRLTRFVRRLTVTEGRYAGDPMKVLGWQRTAFGAVVRHNTIGISMARGNGKALALDTPVLTTEGWSRMGDLRAGQYVYGSDGRPTRIVAAHDVLLGRECYRIDFDAGESIVADSDHLWFTIQRARAPGSGHWKATGARDRGDWREQVRSTVEIADTVHDMDRGKPSPNHRIPIAGALHPPSQRPSDDLFDSLFVKPYVLGFWLGDGSTDSAAVTIGRHDEEETLDILRSEGCRIGARVGENAGTFSLHGLRCSMERLHLIGHKHIPERYFHASFAERLALLQGLVDSDGYVMKQGSVEITTTKRRLMEDYVRLIRTLGFKCRVPTALEAKLNGRVVGTKYRIQFHPGEAVVARLPRKAAGLPRRPSRVTSLSHYIRAVEPIDSVPVRCITVDAADGLYLAGQNLIPTHNTAWASALACAALHPDGPLFLPRGEIVMVASSHGQARIAFRHVYYFMRPFIEADPMAWRVRDSTQLSQIEHRPSGTVLKALGSDPKRAHGLAPTLIIADEPAKWIGGGREMYVALDTSRGKQMLSKFVAIGTRPDESDHWFSELLASTDPDTWSINHCAEKGDPDFTVATIRKANPSYSHMPDLRDVLKKDAERAREGGSYLHAWRALRLNMGTPEVAELERLVALEDWEACTMPDPPPRAGPVFVGVDLGGGTSMSAVAFYWPECGRLEAYGAFPARPGLAERGKQDFVGDRYVRMLERGELVVYPGMATNNIRFLEDMFNRIAGEQIGGIGADRYKDKELKHVLLALGRNPDNDVEWRGVGHGPDGMADVTGFQREVLEGVLKTRESLILASAINDAILHRHPNGYPTLDKRRFKGRIDVMQAGVIAVGMGHRYRCPPEKPTDYDLGNFVL